MSNQKKRKENFTSPADKALQRSLCIWCAFAALSLILLCFDYFTISIELDIPEAARTSYSGYGLLRCLGGTVSLSGYMVIFLIATDIAAILTGLLGGIGKLLKPGLLKELMVIQSVFLLITTIVPWVNITNVLAEFDADLSKTSIGPGCYLNAVLAVAAVLYYAAGIDGRLNGLRDACALGEKQSGS